MQERNSLSTFNTRHALITLLLVVLFLVIDQTIKVEVKTTMLLGQTHEITSWFKINFVENMGMAYGMTFINKIVLSLFRIVAICLITYYVCKILCHTHRLRYLVCWALVLAGATGNIIDSMFYGMIFSPSTYFSVSEFVPFGQGYGHFLQGKVVDMFYFPLFHTTLPEWLPFVGGEPYTFFSPVFNFADACITTGIASLFIFCRKDLDDFSFKKNIPEE